jgi:thymidylate kinase
VYQGQKIGLDKIMDMTMPCREMLKPDLTIFLDVPPDVCYERIKNRDDGRLEIYSLQELESYRRAYLDAIEQLADTERICTITYRSAFCGIRSVDDAAGLIFRTVIKFLKGTKIYGYL